MDGDQPTQDFHRWLESLDEAEVRAQSENVERSIDRLQRRRELLEQAVLLKREWSALETPAAWQASVPEHDPQPVEQQLVHHDQQPFDHDQQPSDQDQRPSDQDQQPYASAPEWESQTSSGEPSSSDEGSENQGAKFPPHSLAARLGR
jgi:hypothetical protein